ncbi:MAG TPA: zf-HC2 domain-containing protein [Thermoanaerobaculia bacterium]|nr:zf-HC2 domain-containing protein [Thermoanaerobaculia bacterium]
MHLTPDLVRGWRALSLSAEETLAVSDHLEECADCARALADDDYVDSIVSAVDRALDAPRLAAVHLSQGELERWTDGRAAGAERARVQGHLAECPACRDAAEDLADFAAGGTAGRAAHRWWGWPATAGLAASLLLISGLLVMKSRARPPGSPPPAVQRVSPPAAAAGTAPGPARAAGDEILLRDGGVQLKLRSDGSIDGVPAPWQAEVAALVDDPELAIPAVALALARTEDVQRGDASDATGAADRIRLESPLSTVVLDPRPVFRWQGPEDSTYRVDVFGPGFAPVDSSGVLHVRQWRPSKPLPAGRTLTWKLTAIAGGGDATSHPRPPAAPAVFQVADTATVRRVSAARATESHLLTGLALWHAGALEAATRELAALAAANPDSKLARKLAAASAEKARRLRSSPSPGPHS